jgi:hypothetical protein
MKPVSLTMTIALAAMMCIACGPSTPPAGSFTEARVEILTGSTRATVSAARVTPAFFSGASPLLGRVIVDGDRGGTATVVVLSHQLWMERFAGNRTVIGQSMSVDGGNAVIVGVMPRDFDGTGGAQLWMSR